MSAGPEWTLVAASRDDLQVWRPASGTTSSSYADERDTAGRQDALLDLLHELRHRTTPTP